MDTTDRVTLTPPQAKTLVDLINRPNLLGVAIQHERML